MAGEFRVTQSLTCAAMRISRGVRHSAHSRFLPLSILALLLMALPCAGQDDSSATAANPVLLDPIVTVATREDRPLREVAGNVTVVTREDMDASLSTSLDDIFRYVPGVDVSGSGTRFGDDGFILRGIGGNRVALELDGVPLSQQFGIGNFSNATRDLVDVGLVQRIEVLHGPASALYGSSALGGVVSMTTPDPADLASDALGRGFFLSQGAASADDSFHTMGAASLSGERISGIGMIGVRSGHERDAAAADDTDRQDYDSRTALAKFVYEDALDNRLRGTFYGYDADVDTDVQSVLGDGRFRSTTRLEGSDDYRFEMAALEYVFTADRWVDGGTLQVFGASTDIEQDTVDLREAAARPVRIDRKFEYDQDSRGVSFDLTRRMTLASIPHRIGIGAEWVRSDIVESRDGRELGLEDGQMSGTVLGETFPVRDFPKSDVDEIGAYIHDEMDLGRVRLIGALRFDRYELDASADAIYRQDNPATEVVDISEDEFSPKLGLIVELSNSMDGWMQYSHGFRGPSFEDANIGLDIPMFNIRAIPNPDLRPETSDGIEAGLRWRSPRLQANAGAFYSEYEDFIETKVRLGVDPESGRILFQSRNIDRARIYGVEFDAAISLQPWVSGLELRAAAFWARGDNREANEPLNSVGPPQAVLAGSWTSPSGSTEATLAGTFTRRHSRLDESGGELFEAPGYGVADFFITPRWGEHLVVRAGLENLLDKTYWRWAQVRGFAPGDPAVPLLSEPGRSVSMDLRWVL
ncbi:MAG: TonB-dependent receptor [Gammaproteobacteria bacterium]|nr:MAG: TonB-dependent receptor [Gammaproteobacteria bacterium]